LPLLRQHAFNFTKHVFSSLMSLLCPASFSQPSLLNVAGGPGLVKEEILCVFNALDKLTSN